MTRQQKYPDTHCFHFHNENPYGRFTSDCVVRAIARATGDPYEVVLESLVGIQIATGYGYTENRVIDEYLTGRGFTKHKQPRSKDGTKFTGDEFCLLFNPKRAVANIGGNHTVAIIDGKINDTWDSSGGMHWCLLDKVTLQGPGPTAQAQTLEKFFDFWKKFFTFHTIGSIIYL